MAIVNLQRVPLISNGNFYSYNHVEGEKDSDGVKITVPQDPLVLSCTLYRLRKIDPSVWHSLTLDGKLAENLNEEDISLADKIRTHFQHKLLLLKLKLGKLSKFRTDLTNFLNSNSAYADGTYSFPNSYVGMLYKLPYFYEYDKGIETIFDGMYSEVKGAEVVQDVRSLKFITKLLPHSRRNSNLEYWFTDVVGNKVSLVVEKNNPLAGLWESVIRQNDVLIDGRYEIRRRDSISFYQCANWEIVL